MIAPGATSVKCRSARQALELRPLSRQTRIRVGNTLPREAPCHSRRATLPASSWRSLQLGS